MSATMEDCAALTIEVLNRHYLREAEACEEELKRMLELPSFDRNDPFIQQMIAERTFRAACLRAVANGENKCKTPQ